MVRLSFLFLSLFILFAQETHGGDESSNLGTPSSALGANLERIRKEFDEMDYQAGEKVIDYPFCSAVIEKHRAENRRILEELAKSSDEGLKILSETVIISPSDETLAKKAPRTFLPSGKKQEASAQEGTELTRPAFFNGETLITVVSKQSENVFKDESKMLKEVKASDFVLSTTAYLLDDKRYHTNCWAEVVALHSAPLKADQAHGVVIYDVKKGEDFETTELEVLLDVELNLFAKSERDDSYRAYPCNELKRNFQFFSGDEEGQCIFAANTKRQANKELTFYNLDVALTGNYFVGPLSAQILVRN